MVIVSAWATAFIVLFLAFLTLCPLATPGHTEAYGEAPLILLAGAVTGGGWLWFRHAMKRDR